VEGLFLRVGIFQIVDEPLIVRVAAGAEALNGALALDERVLKEIVGLPGLDVLAEIFGSDFGAGFEERDAPSGFSESLGGPATSGSRSRRRRRRRVPGGLRLGA
jgi:hypothetical protein